MLRILLLSDLHAFASARKEGSPSYVDAGKANRSPADDAFEALKELIKREQPAVELVVCAGDLGDRADAGGIRHAWEAIHEIAALAKARLGVAVCGNHDLDSRHLQDLEDPDPKGVLQALTPIFPIDDEGLCDKFWSRNFVTVDLPAQSARLLLINTSAYHGGAQNEIDHGRITRRTVESIRQTLAAEGKRDINALVCHHHPFPHKRLDGKADYEAIRNGQALLDLIDDPSYGPWLVLHGHRHHARIGFAPGTVSPTIVIGAASFSAKITEAANQVHLIEVERAQTTQYNLRGTVTSWTFSYGSGFLLMPSSHNALPGKCGFGYRGLVDPLVKIIDAHVRASPQAYLEWSAIESAIADVKYLNPDQFLHCMDGMATGGLQILFDRAGVPVQVKENEKVPQQAQEEQDPQGVQDAQGVQEPPAMQGIQGP